jgi:hypothetical protein
VKRAEEEEVLFATLVQLLVRVKVGAIVAKVA